MAAHTTTDGSALVRKFQIGRENGSKTGKAVFLEWLSEIPENAAGRKFETRTSESGKVRHYEVFTAIDGIMTDIYWRTRTIVNEDRKMLYVVLDDGNDVQEIEIGDTDNRYSLNLLERLLNTSADFTKTIRLQPYAYVWNDKQIMGMGTHCGIEDLPRPERGVLNVAEPTQTPHKGAILWDFSPVFESLWSQIESKVKPVLPSSETRAAAPQPSTPVQPQPAPFPPTDTTDHEKGALPGDEADELPF